MEGGRRYRCVIGETTANREADVGVARFAFTVIETERVHPFTAAITAAAAHVDLDADPRADRESRVARQRDFTCEFVAGHVRELRSRELAREDFRVGGANHRRPHANKNLPRSGSRRRDLAHREFVLRAENHRQHRCGYLRWSG